MLVSSIGVMIHGFITHDDLAEHLIYRSHYTKKVRNGLVAKCINLE